MFKMWKHDWSYNGETHGYLLNMAKTFMTNELFIKFKNNMIIFMETKDKYFYMLCKKLDCSCEEGGKDENCEKHAFERVVKNQEIINTFDCGIETKQTNINDKLTKYRKHLVKCFIFAELNDCKNMFMTYKFDPVGCFMILQCYKLYRPVLEKISKMYKIDLSGIIKSIDNIVNELKSQI